MSQVLIRRALETALSDLQEADVNPLNLSLAWENVPFTPQDGVPYGQVSLLPAEPDNSTQGSTLYFARGILQILLKYPTGTGPNDAETTAEVLRTAFVRGASFTADTVTVLVRGTPRISPAFMVDGRYCIPVSVPWWAQITA